MLQIFKTAIERAVKAEIDRRVAELPRPPQPPVGYNSLDVIRGAMFHWFPVPFNGEAVWCELRCLNATQIEACGDLSMISINKDRKTVSKQEILDSRNAQERIVAATLNRPRFDDIVKMVTGLDFVAAEKRKQLEEIEAVDLLKLDDKDRADIEARLFNLRLSLAFILPEDAFGFITAWALGADVSNIKLLARQQLLEAAILATNANNDPHDHVSGIFTDRDAKDIDKAAWAVYAEFQKEKSLEKSASGTRWIKSGRRAV